MTELSKSEKEIYDLRLEKVKKLIDKGIESFPTHFKNASFINDIHEEHQSLSNGEQTNISVVVRGRVVSIRSFGKLTFVDVKDSTGKIQLLASKDDLDEILEENVELLDVGDIVGSSGIIMKTKKGELSIRISNLMMLSKSLRTLPEKWHGLKDKETRFRQRYLDLIVNDEAKKTIDKRFKVLKLLREFMDSDGFVEVETPTLQPKAGGAIAKPFVTHHNAMSIDMFLRIAPELYLKRLIIGGYEKVFEVGKVFRNEGIDQTHSPEFTMMESYEAYTDVNGVMDMVEKMCEYILSQLNNDLKIKFIDKDAEFSFPWKRISMFDMVSEHLDTEIKHNSDLKKVKDELSAKHNIENESSTIGMLVYDLFEKYIEDNIVNPTFVTDYPKEASPFARESKEQKGVTERYELFAFGSELANGFSELIDPVDQEARLKEQAQKKAQGDEEAHVEDRDYIEALEYGLPPTGGLGFGIDRFVMMITNNESIREVIAFPHIKPEN